MPAITSKKKFEMSLLHQLLVLLHVVTAAAWFGLSLRLGRQARLAAAQGPAVVEDGSHSVRLMNLFMLLTFVFSMGALFLGGGYAGQMQYHIASALIVVLLAFQYLLIRPAWGKLARLVEAGEATGPLVRRLGMYAGIGHLMWLILLVLMFWNRFLAVV